MLTRRKLLVGSGAALTSVGLGSSRAVEVGPNKASFALSRALPDGALAEAVLESLPGKKPLIKLTYRPPNYETPLDYFQTPITPNDAFFVRYHLADIPDVDAKKWRLKIGGEGAEREITLSLDDLKAMPSTQIVAVNQCAGNRRGLVQPHIPGVQWGYGAMGCALWRGVRLKDLLETIGVTKEAVEVVFDGADEAVLDKTPDFVKSIPLSKALEETTLVAFEMNGEALPRFNGFPARIVVPGWAATYWVKHVVSILVATKPAGSFWMNPAYRIPVGKFASTARFPSQETEASAPITEIMVNSLITTHADGETVVADRLSAIGGLAWDGGHGVRSVEISLDRGATWRAAKLGDDLGPFAFRMFSFPLTKPPKGQLAVMARATNAIGQTQPTELIQNPAGYHHNVIHSVTLNIA